MKNSNEILDRIHRIREEMWHESKRMSVKERVDYDNHKCDKILKKWGIKLRKADYLLKAVK